jgi:hypothetical protein
MMRALALRPEFGGDFEDPGTSCQSISIRQHGQIAHSDAEKVRHELLSREPSRPQGARESRNAACNSSSNRLACPGRDANTKAASAPQPDLAHAVGEPPKSLRVPSRLTSVSQLAYLPISGVCPNVVSRTFPGRARAPSHLQQTFHGTRPRLVGVNRSDDFGFWIFGDRWSVVGGRWSVVQYREL